MENGAESNIAVWQRPHGWVVYCPDGRIVIAPYRGGLYAEVPYEACDQYGKRVTLYRFQTVFAPEEFSAANTVPLVRAQIRAIFNIE